MNHKVVPCEMALFHGHTSMVITLKKKEKRNDYLEYLGPSLGVNRV